MVYGMILLGHIKWEPTEQRVGIQNFAKKIGLKKYIKPKRISEHLIYAEYHYSKYPDELGQARHICKKIVRRIAK